MVEKNMQKSKVKVVDNFLPQNEFNKIKFVLEGSDIPWYWNEESIPGKDNPYYDDTPQLCHTFISWDEDGAAIISPFFSIFKSTGCLIKLSAHSLVKFKANLNYQTLENHVGGFHTDFQEEQKNGVTTSILYINTNNGGTQFEDGTRVKSIANRMVTFDCSTKHAPVSCTDKKRRIVVNFNYYKSKEIMNKNYIGKK